MKLIICLTIFTFSSAVFAKGWTVVKGINSSQSYGQMLKSGASADAAAKSARDQKQLAECKNLYMTLRSGKLKGLPRVVFEKKYNKTCKPYEAMAHAQEAKAQQNRALAKAKEAKFLDNKNQECLGAGLSKIKCKMLRLNKFSNLGQAIRSKKEAQAEKLQEEKERRAYEAELAYERELEMQEIRYQQGIRQEKIDQRNDIARRRAEYNRRLIQQRGGNIRRAVPAAYQRYPAAVQPVNNYQNSYQNNYQPAGNNQGYGY